MENKGSCQKLSGFFSCFWLILILAILVRVFWQRLFANFIGADAVRYLWISEHVRVGEWQLLLQLFTSPLLPLLVGIAAWFTGETLWTGRVLCLLGNTLAVGLAMLLVRRGCPKRPALALLVGIALAVNHVWARTATFILADNLFYPAIMGLLCLFLLVLERPSFLRGIAFGMVWAFMYFARDIGLYAGAVLFLLVLAASWPAADHNLKRYLRAVVPFSLGSLGVLLVLLSLWGFFYYKTFGIFSLGEGPRFYLSGTTGTVAGEYKPYYHDGTQGFFQHRPYEMMEYTRFPQPGDARYPAKFSLHKLVDFQKLGRTLSQNIAFSLRELQLASLPGLLSLVFLLAIGYGAKPLHLTAWASILVVGLHLLSQVREARHIAWFFPWIFLGLGALTLWLWEILRDSIRAPLLKKSALGLLAVAFVWHVLYPQYFREVPQRWHVRHCPQVHQLAAQTILQSSGPGKVISAREPEIAYWAKGYWIGLPHGSVHDIIEWLYLGGADYVLFHDVAPIPAAEALLWGDPVELQQMVPELELVATYSLEKTSAYGKHGRLFRFQPQPAKLAQLQQKYPWAGTHPRVCGARAVP